MLLWVIGDTHFNHPKLCDYEFRPQNYQDIIIKNWQWMVGKNDTIIHLGDVVMRSESQLPSILNELPGVKILVRGNHDGKTVGWYMRAGFSFVCDSIRIGNTLLSHEPVLHLPSSCKWNIHGHVHRNVYEFKSFHIPFIIEDRGYKPVLFSELQRK